MKKNKTKEKRNEIRKNEMGLHWKTQKFEFASRKMGAEKVQTDDEGVGAIFQKNVWRYPYISRKCVRNFDAIGTAVAKTPLFQFTGA